jgi:hypothetical protein
VLFAALIPVIVLFFLLALGVAALLDVRAHAAYALGVATRAAARQVDYGGYGEGGVRFDDGAEATARAVFSAALALRPSGLADSPGNIAAGMELRVGYGSRDSPWESPFAGGRPHYHPTVAAQVLLPVRVWMFELRLPVISETEVR